MRYALFTVLSISLISCSSDMKMTEEENIINDLFIELVGTRGYFLPPNVPPLPLEFEENPTAEDSANYREELDQFSKSLNNPEVDSSVLNLFVVGLNPTDTSDFGYQRLNDYRTFHANFHMDSTWMPIYHKLSSLTTPQKLDFEKITNTGRYVIVNEETYLNEPQGSRSIAAVQFSRIAFSEDHTRAVFQFFILFGPLSGGGDIIFAEKVDDTWTVVHRANLWVA